MSRSPKPSRLRRSHLLVIVGALALVASALIAGCHFGFAGPVASAAQGLSIARSSVTTAAPDAKLLLVETAQPVLATSTPVWRYLFGSPSTDDLYLVDVANGASMGAKHVGSAGLARDEWVRVPSDSSVAIDSDAALANALAVSGAHGTPTAYVMSLGTYRPDSATSTVRPLVWVVQFFPGSSGAVSSPIYVDAITGHTSFSQ